MTSSFWYVSCIFFRFILEYDTEHWFFSLEKVSQVRLLQIVGCICSYWSFYRTVEKFIVLSSREYRVIFSVWFLHDLVRYDIDCADFFPSIHFYVLQCIVRRTASFHTNFRIINILIKSILCVTCKNWNKCI